MHACTVARDTLPSNCPAKLGQCTDIQLVRYGSTIILCVIYKKEHTYRQLKLNGLDMLIIITKMNTLTILYYNIIRWLRYIY